MGEAGDGCVIFDVLYQYITGACLLSTEKRKTKNEKYRQILAMKAVIVV